MGVYGLQGFMKKNHIGYYIKISNKAEEYRKKRRKRPVLLVDIPSCLTYLYGGKSLPLAAELKKYKEKCEQIIDRFHDLDIELYIIAEGLKPAVNVKAWIERSERSVEDLRLAYDSASLGSLNWRGGFLFPIALEVFSSSEKCKFHRALYDADDFIAQYLKEWGAFGVLSNDSDFLFMEGYDHFFSIRDLDWRAMRTFNLDRLKLAKFLSIDPELLPFVGTLCPNNVLDKNDLKQFYDHYGIKDLQNFRGVAGVVSKLALKGQISKGSEHLQSVLHLNEPQLEKFRERLTSLSGGHKNAELKLTNYKNWDDILVAAKGMHCRGLCGKTFMELLLGKTIFLAVGLERVSTTTPDEELKHLRRKIYALMFSEYPEEVTVTEHLFEFSQDTGKAEYCRRDVTFERVPPHDHMGLLKLWSADPAEDVRQQRHKLFFGIINDKLDVSTLLEKVQLEFLFPLLAVFYLHYELGKFEGFEADTLLMQAVLANRLSSKEVAEYSPIVNFDALNLSGWFLKMIDHLELLNAVCGNPFDRMKTNLVNYFEGLLMQAVYAEMKTGVKIIKDLNVPDVVTTYESLKGVLNEMKQSCGF